MKNFFEHQDQARRTTAYLVFLFACAIATTVISLYIASVLALSGERSSPNFWQPELLAITTVSTCGIIGFGSLYKMSQLRGGGQIVAASLGGQLVRQDTANPQERALLNVVEEMAIAAGVAVPEVYILPEAGINAFAAGLTPNAAVIGVTQGTLTKLHRNELQGVIGHEFSHIVNGDMAINLKLMGLIHGLFLIHLIGREFLFNRSHRSSSKKDKNPLIFIAISMFIIGIIGYVFGQLIKSAISRQREFLADAAAVQFTRDPNGITDALWRIAQQPAHSARMRSAQAESASHLFFNDISLLGAFAAPFSTHPPLAERIRRLGGGSETLAPIRQASPASEQTAVAGSQQRHNPLDPLTNALPILGLADGHLSTHANSLGSHATIPLTATEALANQGQMAPEAVVSKIGTVTPAHLHQAHSILSHLPNGILDAVRSQPGAVAVVYGLLLDADANVRSHQKQIILNSSQTVYELLEGIESLFEHIPVRSRLPLLEICIPTLKQLKPKIAAQFFTRVKALVQADGKLSLTEFAIQCLLQYRLAPYFRPEKSQTEVTSLSGLWPDAITLMSALARAGHTDQSQIDYAFRSGLQQLPGASKQSIPHKLPTCNLNDLSRALNRLRHTSPKLKHSIAEACSHIVLIDHKTTDSEAELLRAVLISLGCPVPPFLEATAKPKPHPYSSAA